MSKVRVLFACSGCGQQLAQWAGRCPGCGSWGTIEERAVPRAAGGGRPPARSATAAAVPVALLGSGSADHADRRVATGVPGLDRVLGGGLVPGSVVLLAGEPGIGKSTLLLQLVSTLSSAGLTCLLASGEESREQVSRRASRLGVEAGGVSFVPGRDLEEVVETARATRPAVLAVDSIQTIRDLGSASLPGGAAQVRACADALVGLAKAEAVTVVLTGHVTKDGDLAGPRTLEHAVDVVLSFEGDPRSGMRTLAGGKNRFGPEGEVAWFEMGPRGLSEVDPGASLAPGDGEAGAAVALPLAGRRALAVEVQALVAGGDGPARRQVSGLDLRRFSLVAAVLDRSGMPGLARRELYGAAAGGMRVDDPAADLAVAAALASSAAEVAPPPATAFVGEVSLTGQVRPVAGMDRRLEAARARGIQAVVVAPGSHRARGLRIVEVRTVAEAVTWSRRGARVGAVSGP